MNTTGISSQNNVMNISSGASITISPRAKPQCFSPSNIRSMSASRGVIQMQANNGEISSTRDITRSSTMMCASPRVRGTSYTGGYSRHRRVQKKMNITARAPTTLASGKCLRDEETASTNNISKAVSKARKRYGATKQDFIGNFPEQQTT